MSKNSPRQNYTQFVVWHEWAKSKYPAFRTKKKKASQPRFSEYGK